jgi:hypothetical protein
VQVRFVLDRAKLLTQAEVRNPTHLGDIGWGGELSDAEVAISPEPSDLVFTEADRYLFVASRVGNNRINQIHDFACYRIPVSGVHFYVEDTALSKTPRPWHPSDMIPVKESRTSVNS